MSDCQTEPDCAELASDNAPAGYDLGNNESLVLVTIVVDHGLPTEVHVTMPFSEFKQEYPNVAGRLDSN